MGRIERTSWRELGAIPGPRGTTFRVWAPKARRVTVTGPGAPDLVLDALPDGWHAGLSPDRRVGALYGFRLDDGAEVFADPASRFQPDGPLGLSEVVDPGAFAWTDAGWRGVPRTGQVLYEMHVGTFTAEGTYAAAAERLEHLAETGITVVELMPVNDFAGRFGWGYDGVNLYAPTRLYGRPDDLRRFVDRAHALGIGVILDVVYNHIGPTGNTLADFAEGYFTDRYANDWGRAINFEDHRPARDFFIGNAAMWVADYHFDGLRIDATQDIHDASPVPVLAELSETVRAAAGERSVLLVGENEPQDSRLLRTPAEGGLGLDAIWCDDFHHAATAVVTGRREAYYTDTRGRPQEFVSSAKYGPLFQGQRYSWQDKRRGAPALGMPVHRFVTYLDNHDQVANSARGLRFHVHAGPALARAMTAVLLLLPGTPMLFQGQEFFAASPFHYFADHGPALDPAIRQGRLDFLDQFVSLKDPEIASVVADPADPATFARSKLDWRQAEGSPALRLTRDLLAIRREDPAVAAGRVDGAVIGEAAFALRYFAEDGRDRLLLVNMGGDLVAASLAEPLVAPPGDGPWRMLLSTEAIAYGGTGVVAPEREDGWRLSGRSAVLLG